MAAARGFLPEDGHLDRLPPAYEAWERVSERLPELNRSGGLPAAVGALPHLDAAGLRGGAELRRACVLLSQLVQSYVNGPTVPWKELPGGVGDGSGARRTRVPAAIARPFLHVCRRAGLPPVLVASVADIWNCVPREGAEAGPRGMRLVSSMTGTKSEQGFHFVPGAMHRAAAPLVDRLTQGLPAACARMDDPWIEALCAEIAALWATLREQLLETWQEVDPREWYVVYRPLLSGWWPDPIVLCGAGAGGDDVPCVAKGPSAGQSAMFALFDSL
eukprot:TRINITY_DN37276_c0_g1_i5.p2 TRINITY_DN37276_c0_g1~~TRINITY_DN37276_c0_g1_i5.p2  ORF type:complete len:298 (+),score=92.74 TRINITY_DN37276_c0_g1_i5:74-895(+)